MSDDLIAQYRALAAKGDALRGLSILRYRKRIGQLVKQHRARTLLDFGCGGGDAYRQPHRVYREWGLRWGQVRLYDPAFPEHARVPKGRFDAVLCSDVLEHVPEAEVDAFVAQLFAHAGRFVWASVCTRPAKKTFPDGTNLHVTQRPVEWWREVFARHAGSRPWFLEESP